MFKFIYATHPPVSMTILSIVGMKWSVFFLVFAVVFILDSYGRGKDFLYLRDKTPDYFTEKRMSLYGKSWCGRTLVKAFVPSAKHWYYERGYRWWHLLPDGSLSVNSPLFSLKFWTNLVKGHE